MVKRQWNASITHFLSSAMPSPTYSLKKFNPLVGAAFSTLSQNHTLWQWGKVPTHHLSFSQNIQNKPHLVGTITNTRIEAIASGVDHYAFVANGKLYTLGNNKFGQLGCNQDIQETGTPQEIVIPGNPVMQSVSCGAYHTAAISDQGKLYTWGWGGSFFSGAGALGQGNKLPTLTPSLVESLVEADEKVKQVACGSQHTLVLTENGQIFSCGRAEYGRLGRGNHGDQVSFHNIEYFGSSECPQTVVKIDCGGSFSSALTADGTLYVWGRNDYGQLGLECTMGDVYSHEIYPRPIRSLQMEGVKVTDFSCGERHMVALSNQGIIFFWGARVWLQPKPVTMHHSFQNSQMKQRTIKVATGGSNSYFCFSLSDSGVLHSWGRPKSECMVREVNKDANEPKEIDATYFNNEKIIDVVCGRTQCLAVTAQ